MRAIGCRRAAGELRERITARLGRTCRQPIARTFHSYAFGLLRADAAMRGEPAPRLLSGPEQDVMVRELLRGDVEAGLATWPARLRPALLTRGFAQALRDLLQRAANTAATTGWRPAGSPASTSRSRCCATRPATTRPS